MTEQLAEGFNPGILDLSDADTSGSNFDAIPANRYPLEVWDMEWKATKEDSTGALGPNFPYINVQLRISEGEFENRRLFTKFFPKAPEGYDPKKAATNKGSFVNFISAVTGLTEEAIKSPEYKVDFETLKAKPFIGIVSKDVVKGSDPVEYENNLKGFKAVGDTTTETASQGTGAGQLL